MYLRDLKLHFLLLSIALYFNSCSSCGGSKDPNNTRLSSITLSEGTLIPSFSADHKEYTAYIGINTRQITVTISPEDEYATLKLNGTGIEPNRESTPENMYLGSNGLEIDVTSANKGHEDKYTVTVIRKMPDFSARVSSGDGTPSGNAEQMGFSVSTYEDTVIAGAPYYGATDTGIAYVFSKGSSSWTKSQTITPPVLTDNDEFGYSVAIGEGIIAISAPNEDTTQVDSGAVYVYTKSGNTWTIEQTIKADTPTFGGQFGYKIAISGKRLVISEPGANDPQPRAGNIHIYNNDSGSWTLEQTLNADTFADDNAYLGKSLAVNGSVIAAGAPSNGTFFGAVFLFFNLGTSWALGAGILDPELSLANSFGEYIALNDSYVAAAVPSGIYICSSTSCTSEPIGPANVEGLWLYEDIIIAGVPSANGGSGALYVYGQDDLGRWSLTEGPISPDDVQSDENFGKLILGTSSGRIIIGSPLWDTTTVSDAGACYIMD